MAIEADTSLTKIFSADAPEPGIGPAHWEFRVSLPRRRNRRMLVAT